MAKRRHEAEEDCENPQLLSLLECPVCFEGPILPPLMQCEKGHMLCGACRAKPSCRTCPTCGVGPLSIRNVPLERLASRQLSAPCKNTGCGRMVRYGNLEAHARTCEWQPFPCCVQHCDTVLPLDADKIVGHLKEAHRYVQSPIAPDQNSGAMFFFQVHHGEVRGTEWPGKAFSACGAQFVLRMLDVSMHYSCIVQFLGPVSMASSFVCRLTFEEGARCLQWTGPPSSISTPCKQLLESGDCLVVKRKMMKLVREEEGVEQLRVRLEIRRSGGLPPFEYGEGAARFHFVDLKSLQGLQLCIADICGVVTSVLASATFIDKDGHDRAMYKVLVVDDTAFSLEVILVGSLELLSSGTFDGCPVVAIKDVEVQEQREGFRGFANLIAAQGDLVLEPETRKARRVRLWWDSGGAALHSVTALSLLNSRRCSVAEMRNALGHLSGDKVECFSLVARLAQVALKQCGKPLPLHYQACAEARDNGLPCHARVRGNGSCDACSRRPRQVCTRLKIRCQFVDFSRRGWLTTFHEAAERVLAMSAVDAKLLEYVGVERQLQERYFTEPVQLTVRAELDTCSGKPVVSASCIRAWPVNRREHGRALLGEIREMLGGVPPPRASVEPRRRPAGLGRREHGRALLGEIHRMLAWGASMGVA